MLVPRDVDFKSYKRKRSKIAVSANFSDHNMPLEQEASFPPFIWSCLSQILKYTSVPYNEGNIYARGYGVVSLSPMVYCKLMS